MGRAPHGRALRPAGFGRSPVPADALLAPAREVAALLDRRGGGPVAVVGASFGGSVALELAVARPDLVDRLVLVASALPGHAFGERVRAFGAAEDAALEAGDLDAAVELNVAMWAAGPTRTVAEAPAHVVEQVRAMQRRAFELVLPHLAELDDAPLAPGFEERLGAIAAPALVLTGALDQPDFEAIGERLARELRHARHVRIEGAAHLVNLEQPAAFDAAVLPFLDGGNGTPG